MNPLLKALTNPRAVALIGASDNPAKLTARPQLFLRKHGFAGAIYPVNPNRTTVQGIEAFPSVSAIPNPIDHAYILLDADDAIQALEDCARAGVNVVSVLADGFAEAGQAGVKRQARLAEVATSANILLIGPNSTGIVDTRSGFACTTNAAFNASKLTAGRIAVLSQSGSVIGTIVSRGQARGLSFSTLVSVGNEACTDIGRIGTLLLSDPAVDGFILFLETIRDAPALAAFARAAALAEKPISAYFVGRSAEGKALSASHTGALTGETEAISAFFKSLGIATVEQFEALFEAPAALAKRNRLRERPRTLTVVSTTGGGGAMLIDQLSLRGVEIAACSERTRATLSAQAIPLGHGKLIDVTLAGARYESMKSVVSELIHDPQTGAVLVVIGSSAQFNPELAVNPIIDALATGRADCAPVFAFPLPDAPESIELLANGGVPTFRTVESCADTLANLINGPSATVPVRYSLPAGAKALLSAANCGILHELEAGEIFRAMGIAGPKQVFCAVDAPLPTLDDALFPVVAKLVSRDILHKTEIGAIKTDLQSAAELADAIEQMKAAQMRNVPSARVDGILVQQHCKGLGEALIGLTRDPSIGPVITLASGGLMTEIYRDTSVRPAPVSRSVANEMIAEVKAFALLRGYRGTPMGDLKALANAVHAVSLLAVDHRVVEAEINPVLIHPKGQGITMLDALMRLE